MSLLPVSTEDTTVVGGEKKKGNTKARALIEIEKAERAEKSTDRAKPNEPETSSSQAAAGSLLTVPEFHADTAFSAPTTT